MIGETINAPYAEKFTVSNVFSSDMVVQRGEHIRVWGFADASENGHKVSGEFMGMFAEARIENGAWTLTFGARLNACAEQGNSMRIYTDRTAFVFENVLVGDVFMVIGQSNVAYSMAAHRAAVPEAERGGVGYDVPSTPIRLHYNSLMQETGVTRGTEEVCAELRNRETWKRADAAADFHGKRGLPHDALNDGDVFGHARARTVEVDNVNPGGTLGLELPRLFNGVVVIDRHLGIIPLGKAHGAAFQDIDCREKVHVSAFLSEIGAATA